MHRLTLAILLSSVLALGCDSDEPGTIVGIVSVRVGELSIAATRNIAISIADSDLTTTVTADGYRLEDVPAGSRYSVLASATEDVPEGCRRWITGGKGPVTVAPGETVTADITIDGVLPGNCYAHIGVVLN